jgi:hypothetical protein
MSLATVHYLSMNVHSGQITLPAPDVHGNSVTFTAGSLAPSTSHTIAWGDTNTSTVTTNSSGQLSTTHTYASAGTYTMQITETTGGRVVGRATVVVT